MKALLFTVSVSLLTLSSCSSVYNDSFDCPPGKGVSCQSISTVNRLVNQGEVGSQEQGRPEEKSSVADKSPLPLFQEQKGSSPASARRVVRRPEKTVRVWIAAQEQEDGTYISERFVYTVIAPGFWTEVSR